MQYFLVAVLTALALCTLPVPAHVAGPFGLETSVSSEKAYVQRWEDIQSQLMADEELFIRCTDGRRLCPPTVMKFLSIVAEARDLSGLARLMAVQKGVNHVITFMTDWEQWGVSDRWSGPLETFTTGYGDCEDYALAKLVALRMAGVPTADMRLVIVDIPALLDEKELHVVLAVYFRGHWLTLDNRQEDIEEDIHRRDLEAMLSMTSATRYTRLPVNTTTLFSAR